MTAPAAAARKFDRGWFRSGPTRQSAADAFLDHVYMINAGEFSPTLQAAALKAVDLTSSKGTVDGN
jgi:hypothetical protein